MNCRKCRSQLSAYLDGELTAQETEKVNAHLAACGACREELALLQRTICLVKELPPVPAPPALAEQVQVKLQSTDTEPAAAKQVSKWRVLWPAAAVLVTGLALWIFYPPRHRPEPETTVAGRSWVGGANGLKVKTRALLGDESLGPRSEAPVMIKPAETRKAGEGFADDRLETDVQRMSGAAAKRARRRRELRAAPVAKALTAGPSDKEEALLRTEEAIVIVAKDVDAAYAKTMAIVAKAERKQWLGRKRRGKLEAPPENLHGAPKPVTLYLKRGDLVSLKTALANAGLIEHAPQREALGVAAEHKRRAAYEPKKKQGISGLADTLRAAPKAAAREREAVRQKDSASLKRADVAAGKQPEAAPPPAPKVEEAEKSKESRPADDLIKVTLTFKTLPKPTPRNGQE